MLPSAPLVRGAMALGRWLPASAFRATGTVAGALSWLVARRRRAILVDNARHLSPGATDREVRAIARRTFRHLMEDATDLFRLPALGREGLLRLARLEGLDELRAAQARGRGVIVVTPHLGPYELGGACVAALGLPVHALVEDLAPETNAALAAYRAATGLRLVSRNSGLRQLYRLLRGQQIVLLVADRVIGEGSEGLVVPFGDGCRRVPTGPAAFALATGAPVVVAHIARGRTGAERYLVHFDPPIDPAAWSRDDLTRMIAARLDRIIREHPDQWYVFQPEWLPRDPRA